MALRYYKTTGVQPQSQFMPLPLDFIYKQGLDKQARQEAMQGELSKMEGIFKDLKYVAKDDPAAQALQNELATNVDELINTYDGELSSGSATRDYQRLASKWRGDQRALNLQRNYTELQSINEMLAKDKDNMPFNQLAQLNERKRFLERGTYGTDDGNVDFSQDPNLVQNVGVTGYKDFMEKIESMGNTFKGNKSFSNALYDPSFTMKTSQSGKGVGYEEAYNLLNAGYKELIGSVEGENFKNYAKSIGRDNDLKGFYQEMIMRPAAEMSNWETSYSQELSPLGNKRLTDADEKKELELDVYPLTNQYTQQVQINPEEGSWFGSLSNTGIVSGIMLPKLLENAYDKFGDKGVKNLENYISKEYPTLFKDVNMYRAKKDMYKKKGINIDVGEKYLIKSAGLENDSQENQDKYIDDYLKNHNKSLLSDTELAYKLPKQIHERSVALFGFGYNDNTKTKRNPRQPIIKIGNDGKLEEVLNIAESDAFFKDVTTIQAEGKVQDKSPLNGLYQNNNGLPISGEFFSYTKSDGTSGRGVIGGTEPEREQAAKYNLINKLLLHPFGSNYYGNTEIPAFIPTDSQGEFLAKGTNFKTPIKNVYLRRNPISKMFEFFGQDSKGKEEILNIDDKTLGVKGTSFDSEDALQILERLK